MSGSDYEVIVDFVGKHFRIEDFQEDVENSVLAKWELGGLTDPIGQISQWFYNKIAPALNALGNSLSTYFSSLISPIRNTVDSIASGLGNIVTTIESLPGKILNAIESVVGNISSAISSITNVIESLGSQIASIPSYVVNAIQGVISGISESIQSLSGTISSIITYVSEIPGQVVNAVESLLGEITSAIESIPDQISGMIQSIASTIENLPGEIINGIQSMFGSLTTAIESIPEKIESLFGEVINAISSIPGQIENLIQGIISYVEKIPSSVEQLFEPVYHFVMNIPGTIEKIVGNAISGITKYIEKISKSINILLGNIEKDIVNLPAEIKKYVLGAINAAIKGINKILGEIVDKVAVTYTKLKTLFGGTISNILNGINEVKTVLSGFINPLVEIKHIFTNLYKDIDDWVTSVKQKMVDYFSSIPDHVKTIANDLGNLVNAITNLPSEIKKAISKIESKFNGEITIAESFASDAINVIESEASTITSYIISSVETFASESVTFLSNIAGIAEKETQNIVSSIEGIMSSLSTTAKNVISSVISAITPSELSETYSSNMSTITTNIFEGLLGFVALEMFGALANETIISLEVLGLGGQIRSKIGKAIEKMPESFRETLADLLRDIAFAFTFWVIEPVKYQYYRIARNVYPVEIPSLGELIEMTRRQIPTKNFSDYYNHLITSLQYRGYQDWAINAWSNLVSNGAYVTIKDRFGHERKFPTSVLYEIPTVSDLCRMMVKDLFWPEDPLPHFEKAMELHGVIPDIAKMYYMLHFRYPAMDVLFKFICRAAAGFAWVTEKPQTYEDLGYQGVAPADLNNTNWKNATQTLQKYIDFIIPYSKWHDYSPFAWVKGFTADRLIVVDMMAKLPDKIDARWMFKWNIIDDTTFYRLIVSQGYHPNFVDNITIAEILNVIGESRTYVRSGIVELYRYGVLTTKDMSNILSNITTFTALGKNVTVRYLEPEIDMICKRATYDRAYEFVRSSISVLSRMYYENVISSNDLETNFTNIVKTISENFSVNLDIDQSYLNVLKDVLRYEYELYTIGRVRIWIRYLLYRLMERFAEGYVKKSEINDFIGILASEGKLTEPEIELLKESAYLMYDFFVRKSKAEAILRKLARGVISIEQARKDLEKLGIDKEVVEAMIEDHIKIYTFSVDHLIEMSEYVPVDTKYIEEKAELFGMPTTELKLLPAYKVAKDVASYVKRLISELIDDYEYGLIDLKTLEQKIDEVRTLNGQVKKLGVSWIVIDDLEKKLIIEIAKLRRARHELMESERRKSSYGR